METSTRPVTSIKTGVIQEERSFEWEISNFPVVLKQRAMIKAQKFEFYAGESIGMASKWEAFLQAPEKDGMTQVGIFIALMEGPEPILASEHLCAQFLFTFKNKDGVVKKTLDSEVRDWHDTTQIKSPRNGYGFPKVFDMNGELPAYVELNEEGSLVIHVTFRIFALSNAIRPLKVKVEEFEVKSTAKARADLTMLMGNPVTANDIKIIANDKKEFKLPKDTLSARSPVFRAMLEADMTEGNAGVVEIQDMGSKSLKTMLHFMNRGELLPEWMLSDVLVELTNAAAKYELTDLLQFLDGVLGDVCNLNNVGMLIALASRLSLKRAEADLLSFLKRKGASSSENFLQVTNGILASESRAGEEASSGTSAGSSANQSEGGGRPSGCSCACRCGLQGKRNGNETDEDNGGRKSMSKPAKKTRRSQK